LGDLKRVGRIGGKTLGYFLFTTALAAAVGLTLVQILEPGTRITPEVRAELSGQYGDAASERMQVAETNRLFRSGSWSTSILYITFTET
jgi:DAACS family dicarboxylate/amino acid:cation (Na+ or H+) symporter